jgi:hypothetical protein
VGTPRGHPGDTLGSSSSRLAIHPLAARPWASEANQPASTTQDEPLYPCDQPDQPDHRRKSIDEMRVMAAEGAVGFKENLPTTRPACSASSPIAKVEVAFAKCAPWPRVGTSRVPPPRARPFPVVV